MKKVIKLEKIVKLAIEESPDLSKMAQSFRIGFKFFFRFFNKASL